MHELGRVFLGATLSAVVIGVYLALFGNYQTGLPPFFNPGNQGKWIDLTHDFSEDTLYWPTSESFRLETAFAGTSPGGFYYSAYKYSASEHGGTHLGIIIIICLRSDNHRAIIETNTYLIRRTTALCRGSSKCWASASLEVDCTGD